MVQSVVCEMMDLHWLTISKNVFLIEKEKISIVFAPLLGKLFLVDDDSIFLVKEYIENPKKESEFYQYLLESGFFKRWHSLKRE